MLRSSSHGPSRMVLERLVCLILSLVVGQASAEVASEPLGQLARTLVGPDQGVYVEAADGTVLVAQAADRPVHPASVSKVPTTLALLRKLGPLYRFTTTFSSDGAVRDGTLQSNLYVDGDGDPFFVDEDALLVARRIRELGILQVEGRLRPRTALTFDWQDDPDGVRLQKALSGSATAAAWAAVRALPGGVGTEVAAARTAAPAAQGDSPPSIAFLSAARTTSLSPGNLHVLVIHRSQPLLPLLKALNDYSNNIVKPLAEVAGGAAAVQALARSVLPDSMQAEVTLGDGAGTDPRNRMSPRAAVRLLRALDQQLAKTGHRLYDILPVAGIDDGTLLKRLDGPGQIGRVVGKTGTFGDYGASALIGAVPTSDQGTVYFAILNHGVPVPEARRRQDAFVRALLERLHALPWGYQRTSAPAISRAEIESR